MSLCHTNSFNHLRRLGPRGAEEGGLAGSPTQRLGMVPPLPLGGIQTPSPSAAASGEGGDVFSPLTSPKMRRNTFAATLDLIDALCEASARLAVIPQGDERKEELRQMLVEINEALGSPEAAGSACLYPLGDGNERVLHIPPQEAILLNSKDRAPFMLFLEVLEERPGHAGRTGGMETPPPTGTSPGAQSSTSARGGGSGSAEFEGITPPVPLCGAGRMPSNQRVWTKFSIFHLYQSEQRC